MGSTRPNEGGEGEDEDPGELAKDAWVQLLNEDDGVYSLKPWKEVLKAKANKTSIGLACREIMRQAWSEYYLIANAHFLNLILVIQNNQAEGERLPGVKSTKTHLT